MKTVFTFLGILMGTIAVFADGDIPPPPMPDYMKKHYSNEPLQPAKRKLQTAEGASKSPGPGQETKFLQESSGNPTIYQNSKRTVQAESVPETSNDEVKQEFLNDVESEDMPEIANVNNESVKEEPMESLGESVAEAESQTSEGRAPTSFKSGMYKLTKDCAFYQEPDAASAEVGSVKKSKELWFDYHNEGWVKAYKKKSAIVYLQAGCLQ